VTASLLLVHGDDGFEIDRELTAFARRIEAADRADIVPDRSPDEGAIERAALEAGSMSLFGAHLAVLRQPLRAAGRSAAAIERLLGTIRDLPDGAALALAEVRPSRDVTRPPTLLRQLIEAVTARGGTVSQHVAPRRAQLQSWIRAHAEELGARIEPRAAALLAERIGGTVAETDVERGEQTRLAHGELDKLATYAGERAISPEDVDLLVADTRPASIYAITNAVDRRDARLAARAVERAIEEGQPVLRILGALQGRVSDLIVTRDLVELRATPQQIARRVGRNNIRMAEHLVEAAGRYSADELEQMLRGLFAADLAIKTNASAPEPALGAWFGSYLLGMERGRGAGSRRSG
jgi:DNA polymerase III delta subunit